MVILNYLLLPLKFGCAKISTRTVWVFEEHMWPAAATALMVKWDHLIECQTPDNVITIRHSAKHRQHNFMKSPTIQPSGRFSFRKSLFLMVVFIGWPYYWMVEPILLLMESNIDNLNNKGPSNYLQFQGSLGVSELMKVPEIHVQVVQHFQFESFWR